MGCLLLVMGVVAIVLWGSRSGDVEKVAEDNTTTPDEKVEIPKTLPPPVPENPPPTPPPPSPTAGSIAPQRSPSPTPQYSAATILIDAAWLARRGQGPHILDRPGTTYVLQTDVRTESTAFLVGAGDVVLDLNRHQVIYGDSEPPAIVNGGFEQGTGRSVPGWDLGAAPNAQIAANTNLLFGNQVMRLASFNKPQRLLSDPIRLSRVGRPHTATITPANTYSHCSLKLSVVDASSGKELGHGQSSSASRGFAAVVHFTPRMPSSVRLQVEVKPLDSKLQSLDLDQATLTVAGDNGILATNVWSGEITGWANLPSEARNIYKKAANFTVKNGKILQGRGNGFDSSPLYFRNLPGLTVDNVETLATGMDTDTLEATDASRHVHVRNSTFRENIANISHRMRSFATLKLNNIDGPVVIEGNRLIGSPQVGIMVARNNPRYSVRIRNNVIQQNTVVTNGYALILSAVQNFEVSGNFVQPRSGKGFSFDSYTSTPLANGEVHHNVVEVQERSNREYPKGLEAVALRLRNTVDKKGPMKNLRIHDNTFHAHTGPGMVEQAYGVRVSYTNRNGEMNNAGIVLENNLIKAVVKTGDSASRAKALVLDRIEAGINLSITGNIIQSNDISLALGDTSGGVEDVDLISNTLEQLSDSPGRAYTAILAGYYNRELRDVRLFDIRQKNAAGPNIVWNGKGKKEILIGTILQVQVLNGDGKKATGARVVVRDSRGREIYSGTIPSDGTALTIPVLAAAHRQATISPDKIMVEPLGAYQVLAEYQGKKIDKRVAPTAGQELLLTFP